MNRRPRRSEIDAAAVLFPIAIADGVGPLSAADLPCGDARFGPLRIARVSRLVNGPVTRSVACWFIRSIFIGGTPIHEISRTGGLSAARASED